MNLLITGGAGFIGSNFIHYILAKYPDDRIVNLDKLFYEKNSDTPKNLKSIENNKNYKFIKGDICDLALVEKIIKENTIDAIVHFAAQSHVDTSIDYYKKRISGKTTTELFQNSLEGDFVLNNVWGTHILLEAAVKAGKIRFHHISTDEVFGSLGDTGKFDEQTPYNPQSPYSASKASSDHLVRAYHNTYGLPITISNCSNNYGPYQHIEKFIPLFITNLLQGKSVPLYGEGKNIRDWLYVEDHCQAIDLIIHKGKIGETYCIGGNAEKRNIDIAKLLVAKLGADTSMIERVEDRLGHDYRYAIDASKIEHDLGWQPTMSFEEGIEKTIEWYKSNREWWRKK